MLYFMAIIHLTELIKVFQHHAKKFNSNPSHF
uniref:Uncharacterized protein n=1 Tax=Rhizophora mucronata TaxID=61149 RepID=A0A2P2PRC3_RHIMU